MTIELLVNRYEHTIFRQLPNAAVYSAATEEKGGRMHGRCTSFM